MPREGSANVSIPPRSSQSSLLEKKTPKEVQQDNTNASIYRPIFPSAAVLTCAKLQLTIGTTTSLVLFWIGKRQRHFSELDPPRQNPGFGEGGGELLFPAGR